MPTPADFGIEEAAWTGKMALMAEQALASGSPANNPRVPTADGDRRPVPGGLDRAIEPSLRASRPVAHIKRLGRPTCRIIACRDFTGGSLGEIVCVPCCGAAVGLCHAGQRDQPDGCGELDPRARHARWTAAAAR